MRGKKSFKDVDLQDTWELDQLVQEEEGVQEECLKNKEKMCVEYLMSLAKWVEIQSPPQDLKEKIIDGYPEY